jgi:hypothetical protein
MTSRITLGSAAVAKLPVAVAADIAQAPLSAAVSVESRHGKKTKTTNGRATNLP